LATRVSKEGKTRCNHQQDTTQTLYVTSFGMEKLLEEARTAPAGFTGIQSHTPQQGNGSNCCCPNRRSL